MPRIEFTGENHDLWWNTIGERSGCGASTYDICRKCLINKPVEKIIESMEPYSDCGEEPRGTGVNAFSVDICYGEENRHDLGATYRCVVCDKELKKIDNNVPPSFKKGKN